MRLKLGNGDMASLWNDNWSGGGVLKDLYLRLYALENDGFGPWRARFSVASLRKVIDKKRLSSIYSKTRWVKYVPIKVNVLAWKIKMDVLPTWLNISRR
nr:RNA-directed DNA polymerase, eukaryota [Tanacetum cinerariifolium]